MDLLDALLDSSIRFVMTRHEQGAAFMADVYGRLTGKACVCLATLGPGATNLITGVADANMDRAPLVALTAQAGHDRMHKESHQHLDIVTLFRPVTKWNTSLPTPDIIPDTHPLAHGAIGLQTPDYVNFGFAEADVVIAVGYDVVEYAPRSWNPKRDKENLHHLERLCRDGHGCARRRSGKTGASQSPRGGGHGRRWFPDELAGIGDRRAPGNTLCGVRVQRLQLQPGSLEADATVQPAGFRGLR